MSKSSEDNTLIKRFLGGDVAAFDEIVVKYKGLVFNVCLKMLGNYEEALDLSQDIFLKIYGSLKDFRYEAQFSTYLYKIVLNFCRNRLKVLQRRRRKEAFSIDNDLATEDGTLKREFASDNPNPRDVLDGKEKEALILNAINSLNHDYKEAVILRDVEGLKYEEIAGILNIDLGTVKSRLSRARHILKEKLEGIL
ncbi:MAG: sigma-70 family RNA polymerase sigma factor [Candidatus Omnitrophota bacterium]